jgi:hypothetical protein
MAFKKMLTAIAALVASATMFAAPVYAQDCSVTGALERGGWVFEKMGFTVDSGLNTDYQWVDLTCNEVTLEVWHAKAPELEETDYAAWWRHEWSGGTTTQLKVARFSFPGEGDDITNIEPSITVPMGGVNGSVGAQFLSGGLDDKMYYVSLSDDQAFGARIPWEVGVSHDTNFTRTTQLFGVATIGLFDAGRVGADLKFKGFVTDEGGAGAQVTLRFTASR